MIALASGLRVYLACVVTDMRKAEAILAWAVEKMEERYALLARAGVRHISVYNQLGEEELMDRLHEMYRDALPGRLRAIAAGTRSGNAPAVVSAAHTLAGTSGQLGHPEVASVCRAIAADARRGVMAHARVVELQELARV